MVVAESTIASGSANGNHQAAVPDNILEQLPSTSRACLQRLTAHKPDALPDFGMLKVSAVLVALFQLPGEDGLRVLLTTRAKTMRTHPNQTALPGGRVDPEDPSPIHTAYREANEEVGLPVPPHENIHHIGTLDPVITILPMNAHFKNHIVVIPVVCFISDPKMVDNLVASPHEVDYIFSHPLSGCQTGEVPESMRNTLAEHGGEWWPHPEQLHSQDNRLGATGPYRMHRFRTTHSPIKGVTSDVLINTATIAYGQPPSFPRYAPGQPISAEIIRRVIDELPGILEKESKEPAAEKVKFPLVWGNLETGETINSGETWHQRA